MACTLDNVTHTLAGLLIAEGAIQLRRARQPGAAPTRAFERAAYWVSALANNHPDLDFLYAGITQPAKLGYLLHHRGHTHTLLIGWLISATLMLLFAAVARGFRAGLQAGEWRWLMGLALLGPTAHIALDYSNSYGVHPFWPLQNDWFYGDTIFIVEPWYFVASVPALIFALRSRVMRAVLSLLGLGMLGLVWGGPFVVKPLAALITGVALAAVIASRRLSAPRRVIVAGLAWILVPLVFATARARAEIVLRSTVAAPSDIVDVVLTPGPGNPLCWSSWLLYLQGEDRVADAVTVALAPSVLDLERCRSPFFAGAKTAPLEWLRERRGTTVEVAARHRAPIAELESLRQDCRGAAFLRYARLPFSTQERGETIVGDLRYDRSAEIDFAELALPPNVPCPRWVPSWSSPRQDLLGHAP